MICDEGEDGCMVEGGGVCFGREVKYKEKEMDGVEKEVEKCEGDGMKVMREKGGGYGGIEIVGLKVKYGEGGEKELIEGVMGGEVGGGGGIGINVGGVVENVGSG